MIDTQCTEAQYLAETIQYQTELDQVYLNEEQERTDGGFFVRCIDEKCYRLRDRQYWGEGQDGIYIYFELK